MFFCWIKMSKNTFLSVPLKKFIQIQIFRLRGLEAVILTRTCGFRRPVCTMTTTRVSKKIFCWINVFKNTLF